ncbi:hypothetical protein [Catellatospora tritici]|uniref:hypothetical protein n=1 Tax=Catellatospora tritici TaxID=2851566 RepID=UPI001C2CD15D|nr:hypothetical protein [Catellatospora tritici]MBV1852285.1 hypothetical protein [Catellatospora tritici]
MTQAILCGVSSLLRPDLLVTARGSWQVPGPPRLFDADVSAASVAALPYLRDLVEEFAWRADLLVIGSPDLAVLYGPTIPPLRLARRLRASGSGAVLLRCPVPSGGVVSVLICEDPSGRIRADGPSDILFGLAVTPSTSQLQAALTREGVPLDATGWLDLADKANAT